jgi:hypothetical protein
VKIRFFGKEVALIVCFVIFFSAFVFAAEDQVVSIQGRVMSLDLSKNRMVVSEQIFTWDGNSIFYDEKGSAIPITAERLKKGTRISIEATPIKNKPHLIKTISLLQK